MGEQRGGAGSLDNGFSSGTNVPKENQPFFRGLSGWGSGPLGGHTKLFVLGLFSNLSFQEFSVPVTGLT